MKIQINNKTYDVILAVTEEEQKKGLQDVAEMDDNEGMLFIYDEPQRLDFWMKDTDIPLDIIFIDKDLIVKSVKEGIPNSEELVGEDDCQLVLELNKDSGIKPGMEIITIDSEKVEDVSDVKEVIDEDNEDSYTDDITDINQMYIIGSDGNPQMELIGGERIFSRTNTKTLVNMARKAFNSKSDSDFKKLGSKIFEYIKVQNSSKPDYVDVK